MVEHLNELQHTALLVLDGMFYLLTSTQSMQNAIEELDQAEEVYLKAL